MWLAFRQRVISWFGGGGRAAQRLHAEDFRTSEPVLTDTQQMMEHVGNANVQIGPNNSGTVRVVHLKQERHVTIHKYAAPEPPVPTDKRKQTPEQLKVYRAMRALPRSHQAGVLQFMQREFGTKRFTDISGRSLQRVALYIEAIAKSNLNESLTRETT